MKARSALGWSDGAAGPVLRLVRDETVPPCAASGADFFPGTLAEAGPARAVCATCPLQAPCLAAALERHEPHGVWAGELFANGRPVQPRKRSTPAPIAPGKPTSGGKVAGAVSLWCPNDHRRSVANTKTGGDGNVICLDCARKRSRKSRARKRQRCIPGAVSRWCSSGHRRSVLNTRNGTDGYVVCLDCARDRRARRRALKAAGRHRGIPGSVSLWCRKGHRRSVVNTHTKPSGQTVCLDCDRDRRARKADRVRSGLELVA